MLCNDNHMATDTYHSIGYYLLINMVIKHGKLKGYIIMSIFKHGDKMYVVWDNDGGFARFIGTYDQCVKYKEEWS